MTTTSAALSKRLLKHVDDHGFLSIESIRRSLKWAPRISESLWEEAARNLQEQGVILTTAAAIDQFHGRQKRYANEVTEFLENQGIDASELMEIDTEGFPFCKEEEDIFSDMENATVALEWALYTTPLLHGYVRSSSNVPEESPKRGKTDFADPLYEEFLQRNQIADFDPNDALSHTLRWQGFKNLSPLARLALVVPDDSPRVRQLLEALTAAQEQDEATLSKLEFLTIQNQRIQIGSTVSQLAQAADFLVMQWKEAHDALWSLAHRLIKYRGGMWDPQPNSQEFQDTIEEVHRELGLTREAWIVLNTVLLDSQRTIQSCRQKLVDRHAPLIDQFAEQWTPRGGSKPRSLGKAIELAQDLAEIYDPRGEDSFGVLLERTLAEKSFPSLSAEA